MTEKSLFIEGDVLGIYKKRTLENIYPPLKSHLYPDGIVR